ncbi:hypothetical protein C5B92_07085 [Rathayibacter sp. AY1A4]|uniref:hypothetical protein n=1 Tax=Rathayibacter sp. AY1A4 TaxID=2080522 RepID=UPI000CE8347F|nr:hypothetical protein [Rathayibacter sp. AY1A4]PPF18272.1 hypothetical protein C5B92_07085 [Rathayibacter sp. AY1A4]
MAAAQTAEQKAAAEKAEAERIEAEKAAQEPANDPETPQRVVLGAAVVLALKDGGERYLYRGDVVGSGYTAASLKHVESIGLVGTPKK